MDINTAWNDILNKIVSTDSVSAVAFSIYFEKLTPYIEQGRTLILSTAKASVKRMVEEHYRLPILDAMTQAGSPYNDFGVILESDVKEFNRESIAPKEEPREAGNLSFIPEYTFDNFVVGAYNRIAYEASMAVVENPGTLYNPMFIYSRPGLGKTHLLNAVGNEIKKTRPELKVLYITAENFTNDYIFSIRNSKNADVMQNFNNKYRSQDVLLIDDVQFFEKAEKTQEALFHIFNDLYDHNKQIILSSDRPVKNLTFLEERLASRFAAGITVDIGFPSLEDRIAILQKKAQNLKMNVSQEVLYYLADTERNNIRILEGMLKTVHLYSKLNKHDADSIAFAKEALHDSVITADDNITVQTVADVCCNYFHIKSEDLTGKRRNKEFVIPRQYAMYIITLVLPSTPLTAIGEYFNRDHSTVISARDKIGRLYQTDTETKRIVEDIKNLVLNQ